MIDCLGEMSILSYLFSYSIQYNALPIRKTQQQQIHLELEGDRLAIRVDAGLVVAEVGRALADGLEVRVEVHRRAQRQPELLRRDRHGRHQRDVSRDLPAVSAPVKAGRLRMQKYA